MPVHPELRAFLDLAGSSISGGRRPLHLHTPSDARKFYDQSSTLLDTAPIEIIGTTDIIIPCRDRERIAARLYRPSPSSRSVCATSLLIFFHGGGYCVGNLESHDSLCRHLASITPCAVLSLAYRLAPEYRFPTAFLDSEDAYLWALDNAAHLDVDTKRIALAGDSAGGTLATALCIAARDNNWKRPAAQVLLYPCTSAWQDADSHRRYAQGYLLEAETLQWMFGNYLRNDADRADWRFAPLEATDLSGLPPAFIALAEYDPLVDEGIAYAHRLIAAGVETQLKIYDGMVHDFARLGNIVSEAGEVRSDIAEALAAAFR